MDATDLTQEAVSDKAPAATVMVAARTAVVKAPPRPNVPPVTADTVEKWVIATVPGVEKDNAELLVLADPAEEEDQPVA